VAPAAPRLSSLNETAPPGRESCERGESKVRTVVGAPGAAQVPQSASPLPSLEQLAELDRIVATATATGLPFDRLKGRGLFARLLREGWSTHDLDAMVLGVVHGQGEAAAARSADAPFAFASKNVSLYAHAGQRHREGLGGPPAVSRLAQIAAKAAAAPVAARGMAEDTKLRLALFDRTGDFRWLDNRTPLPADRSGEQESLR